MNETNLAVKKYLDGGIPKIVEQLEMDEYESTGAFLRNNVAFIALKEMSKPKRHPDTNGVLPLTTEELEEFEEKFKKNFLFPIESIQQFDTYLSVNYKEENRYPQEDIIINIEAIIYLNNLFELEVDR